MMSNPGLVQRFPPKKTAPRGRLRRQAFARTQLASSRPARSEPGPRPLFAASANRPLQAVLRALTKNFCPTCAGPGTILPREVLRA